LTGLSRTTFQFGAGILAILLAGACLASVSGGQPPAAAQASRDVTKQAEGISFQGRVMDLDDDHPIEGAKVVVERAVLLPSGEPEPAWAGKTTLRTDAQGRFTITFPHEQVAEPRARIAMRVSHPDYVPRIAHPYSLASMLRGRQFGDKPFLETVRLGKGQIFSATVVTPEGKPAAGVRFNFGNWARRGDDRSSKFSNDPSGITDAQGHLRLRMPRTQALTITLMPDAFAPYYRFWGTDRADQNPDVWAPTELGQLVLEPGQVITGRLLDLKGRPINGQQVIAQGKRHQHERIATTQADGSFVFAPLGPGNYTIFAESQNQGGGIDLAASPRPHGVSPISPAHVFLEKGKDSAAVELRELPSVSVDVRYLDSNGHPTRGGFATLGGTIPSEPGIVNRPPRGDAFKSLSSDEPEIEDQNHQFVWGRQLLADSDGTIRFRVPKGLQNSDLYTIPPDETIAYKTRMTENGLLKFWGGGQLGTIDADRAITIVSYQSPTVLATVQAEEGELPEDVEVSAGFNVRGGDFGERFIRQSDGRYRSNSLMPDHEYEITAGSRGYVPNRVHRLILKEDGFTELALILRVQPKPPEVGKPAPPFFVKPLDGQALSLDDLRGKIVLIHFWMPIRGLNELSSLKAVHDRYGKDGRFAMIGFSLANDPADASRFIKEHGLTWPHVVLRDRGRDPIAIDYHGWPPPATFLIGPDGTLVSRDLKGDGIEKAITAALDRK
jgi:peroxiredoxin